MKKKKMILLVISCAALFSIGFMVMWLVLVSSASPSDSDSYSDIAASNAIDTKGMFSEKYYRYRVSDENNSIVSIERVKPADEMPEDQLYTSQDIDRIMKLILGSSGEIREDKVDDMVSTYDDYKNDLPTGKAISVTYDSGFVSYIVLRDGKMIGIDDPSQLPDKKNVYEKALKAIAEKYADKNLVLKDEFKEENIKIYYKPQKECLYYTFEVLGAIDGKWDDELSVFVFTPMINVNDTDDIEIASTFGN